MRLATSNKFTQHLLARIPCIFWGKAVTFVQREARMRRFVLTCAVGMLGFVIQPLISHAAKPYTPVHPDPLLESWRWRSFPELNGLGVQCMVEDANGTMWFGIDEGVMSYDGVDSTMYTPNDGLLGKTVVSLCAGNDGTVYAGTNLGISKFQNGAWTRTFPAEGDQIWNIQGLMTAFNGDIWAGTTRGALRVSDGKVALLTGSLSDEGELRIEFIKTGIEASSDSLAVRHVYEDLEGQIWLGFEPGAVGRLRLADEGRVADSRLFTTRDGLDMEPTSNPTPRILQTRDKTIWVVSNHGRRGVNRYDGKKWTWSRLEDIGGSNHNPSLLETSDGTLWVGGLGKLHARRGETWSVYSSDDVPIPSVRINSLLETSDGALWMAGLRQEVVRLDFGKSQWNTFEDMEFRLETPDGTLWFIANAEVVSLKNGTWTSYGVKDGLMNNPLTLFSTRSGVLWAAGGDGDEAATATFDGRTWQTRVHRGFAPTIDHRSVFEDANGTLWFGGSSPIPNRSQKGGLLRFDGTSWEMDSRSSNDYVYGIGATKDGAIWIGGPSLVRYRNGNWEQPEVPDRLRESHSDVVYATDGGELWVGHRTYGVFHFDGSSWKSYRVRDGLADNRVRAILQSHDGTIRVGTDRGLSRFDGKGWSTIQIPGGVVIAQGGIRQTADGALWFNSLVGEKRRTIRYLPDSLAPTTRITLSLREVSQPGNTTISWSGSDPWRSTPEDQLQFSYQMDGNAWSPFSGETSHIFVALADGYHVFRVKARDRDLNEDLTPEVVRFTVIPPVWKQGWFIGMMLVLVVVIGYQTFRIVSRDRMLRISNAALSNANTELFQVNSALRNNARELKQANEQIETQNLWKSQFLTSMSHELRTPLNAIIGFSNLITKRAGDILPDRQKSNLSKIRQGGEYLLNLVDDILDLTSIETGRVKVNPGPVNVRDLVAASCATVSSLVKAGVVLSQQVAEDIGAVHTDNARLRQILVNLLGNAIKLTESGEIIVNATKEAGTLVIAVKDTGAGLTSEALDSVFNEFRQVEGSGIEHKDTGLGLSISKRLAELLGGTIDATSILGDGSTFTLRIPIVYQEEITS